MARYWVSFTYLAKCEIRYFFYFSRKWRDTGFLYLSRKVGDKVFLLLSRKWRDTVFLLLISQIARYRISFTYLSNGYVFSRSFVVLCVTFLMLFSDFDQNLCTNFIKNSQYRFSPISISWSPIILFRQTDGRTRMTKLVVAFCQHLGSASERQFLEPYTASVLR
jgi:hypothetical protein